MAGEEDFVFPFVGQHDRYVTGKNVCDPLLIVAVFEFVGILFDEQDTIRKGGQEVGGGLEPDSGILEGALQFDSHRPSGRNNGHLPVSVLRFGEGGPLEGDGNDADGITSRLHRKRFGGVSVRAFVKGFSVGVADGKDKIIGVRNLSGSLGEGPFVQDPAEQPHLAVRREGEVVAGRKSRKEGKEPCQHSFCFHTSVVLFEGRTPCPVRQRR